jgi:outer membrane protein TolC
LHTYFELAPRRKKEVYMMKFKQMAVLIVCMTVAVSSTFATDTAGSDQSDTLTAGIASVTDLAMIVEQAKANSVTIQQYLLTRENSKLAVALDTAKDGMSINVSSGNLTYAGSGTVSTDSSTTEAYDYALTASPQVSIVIPDADNDTDSTILTASLDDSGYYHLSSGDSYYEVNPTVSLQRSITFGKTSDERTELLSRYNTLLADNTFGSSELDFESSIYDSLVDILTAERSIAETTRTLEKAQKSLDDALALKTLSEGSVDYREQELSILSYRNSLASYQAQKDLAVAQFATLTGLGYAGVDGIEEPTLDFAPSTDGNTTVRLKQSALDIAREDLAIKQAEKTNSTLLLDGGGSWSVSKKEHAETLNSGTVSIGASYAMQTFSVGVSTGVSGVGSSSGAAPFVSVSGAWNNNATQESDQLEELQLQNEVLLAQLEYSQALTDYTSDAADLMKEISAWKLEYARLQRQKDYYELLLAYQETLYSTAGLANEEDIKDARLQVELAQYDLSVSLLNGLILENSIASIQL